ncbi:uncharacterized protein LOC108740646 [Agrilus planipennis]|uniref:Uncharacterized protein LOC108740646 n=1 Tax=Agrilus planipennis TaxID=224129 RepID=A0A1W4X334_AGRPL|nr:uncharacterized protein LOC108740646 [Agrilus planipennis]
MQVLLLLKDVPFIVFSVVIVLFFSRVTSSDKVADVNNFSQLKQGMELVILSVDRHDRLPKNYHLEDFFWTGSGDDSTETEQRNDNLKPHNNNLPTKSTTIDFNQNQPDSSTKCIPICDNSATDDQTDIEYNITLNENDVDHQFWLITVLESDGKNLILTDLKDSLEKLYKTAFNRHQKLHLGIKDDRHKRATQSEEVVNVHIHNISKMINDGTERIEVIYHVSVSGKPVIAATAAEDMKLVSDNEIVNELGLSPVIKAEPYLKPSQPEYLETAKNTWLFIGAALSILFLLLLLATLLTLSFSKKKKTGLGSANRRQVFEHGTVGRESDNKSFVVSEADKRGIANEGRKLSSSYVNYKDEATLTKTFKSTGSMTSRPNSCSTSTVSSSDSSLDISPLVVAQKKLKMQMNKINVSRPKGAYNRTAPFDEHVVRSNSTDSSDTTDFSTRDSVDTVLAGTGGQESAILSAKSYLSMPSVKSFPRSNVPDSLNKILQPVSVLHLDLMDDNYEERVEKPQGFFKSNSMSAMEDPGVVGPLVWELHRKGLQESKEEDSNVGRNAAVMRKRFHDLLDDTFSLFGNRRGSLANLKIMNTLSESKSRSAATSSKTQNALNQPEDFIKPRPKTSYGRASRSSEITKPKGAWNSHTPSPLTRPVSAGILKKHRPPQVDVDQILAEGALKPDDPALTLINSIKTEIKKCSLPGSTANLVE